MQDLAASLSLGDRINFLGYRSDALYEGGVRADFTVPEQSAGLLAKGQKARFKMEQTNITVGKQPAELFEIPNGFEKLDMGGMGMGMLKGMMGR